MRVSVKTAASLAAVLAVLTGGPASAMDLAQALAAARAHNPDLAAISAEVEAASARQDRARAAFGPTVSINGMMAHGESDLGGFFGFDRQEVTPSALSLEVSQPLFTSGALGAGRAAATADRRRAEESVKAAQARLTLAVVTAYADAQVAEQGLASARRQATLMAEIARQAGLRFEAGEIARSDYAEATARRAQALADRAGAEAAVQAARAEFARITGQPAVDLAPLPIPPDTTGDLDAFIAQAVAANPEVRAAEQAETVAVAQLRAARAGFGPNVALTAQASQVRDQFLPGYRSDEWKVGVQGRWVLFDSGSTAASVAEQSAGVRAAQARVRAARGGVEAQALSAWHAAHAARLRQVAAQAALEASRISAASVTDEVEADQRPLVDRLDAETRLADAERSKAQADAAVLVAACRLTAVAGDATCAGVFADPI